MSGISYVDADNSSGVWVESKVAVDWFVLGEFLAKQASDSQAQFLLGMCAEFHQMGDLGRAKQFQWISQQVEGTSVGIDTVRGIISELLDGLGGEGA